LQALKALRMVYVELGADYAEGLNHYRIAEEILRTALQDEVRSEV
jgi:hypothetical protein